MNYSNSDYSGAIPNIVISLLVNLGRLIEEDNVRNRKNISAKVDKKLQRVIRKKKQTLGIKESGMELSR